MTSDEWPRPSHGAHQTSDDIAALPAAFPRTTRESPMESPFPDWRDRLTRNLARRSDGRWDPLTWVHADALPTLSAPLLKPVPL
ncbi:MAG TPA: hypothetical protein VJ867_16830 [Gemmatimonadaceae bacterium]|nr:hypothetical protein [Gemmatimonadaceae bacterium]